MDSFLLYGATGYTGEITARLAVQRGLKPVLAGRNREKVESLAIELNLPWRAFPLDDGVALNTALREVPVVLHCAGPFSRTYPPMVAACLRTGTHYLDITGELPEHEALAQRDSEARAAGVMLLPSIGFDVVPSDCLALHLKRRLPSATHLNLAFYSQGGWSRGTATTGVDMVDRPGMVRRDGVLQKVPAAWKTREVDFGLGPVTVVTMSWGDLATAYTSTGTPNITTHIASSAPVRLGLKAANVLGPLLASPPGQALLMQALRLLPEGPSPEAREKGFSLLWGEVTDDAGNRAVSRMRTPHAYTLTALTALAAVERVLAGNAPPGYQTPAKAYGADFIMEIPGVTRTDE